SSTGGCANATARSGSVAAAGAGAGASGDVMASATPDGAGLANTAMSRSAVMALSRAMGVGPCGSSQQQPQQVRAPGSLAATGSAPFARRQSNGSLSAVNTNSGNDVTTMSKALSGLTAWPESPHEGRHVGGPADVTAACLTAVGGSSSSAAGASAITFSRMGSALPSPARKTPLIGGLKSALLAPDVAKTITASSSASASTVAQPMTPQPRALPSNVSTEVSPFTAVLSQAPLPDDDCSLASPVAPARLPSCPSDGPGGSNAAAPVVSPRVIALQINDAVESLQPPSPSSGGGCSAGPSTPTGGGGGGGGVAPAAAACGGE
ncbi:hypothetical protein Vretifemale_13487, partial [Volvox reticuliferus]